LHNGVLSAEAVAADHLAEVDPDQVLAEAEKAGVDLDALRYHLSLTPEQRLEKFLTSLVWLDLAKESRRKVAV